MESGEITREQLATALKYNQEKESKGARGVLAQTLIELGYSTEEAITCAIARQAGVEFVSWKRMKLTAPRPP